MPEIDKKKYPYTYQGVGEKAADDLSQTGAQTSSAISEAATDGANGLRGQAEGLYGDQGTVTKNIGDFKSFIDKDAYKNIGDALSAYKDQIKAAEEEDAAQTKADRRATTWTGVTELAASIANLIGVGGFGAVHQQYRPQSMDWMKKADEDAKYRRSRIDNIRERQKAVQMHLDQLKAADMKAYTALINDAAEKKAAIESKATALETEGKMKGAGIEGDARQKGTSARLQADLAGLQAAEQRAVREKAYEHEGEMMDRKLSIYGITKNSDGTYNIPEGSGRRGRDKAKKYTFAASGRLGEETFIIDPESMRTTVYAALASKRITDLSDDDLKEVDRIIKNARGIGGNRGKDVDEVAKELVPYVTKSGQLRNLMRQNGVPLSGATDAGSVRRGYFDDERTGDNAFLDDLGGGPTAKAADGSNQGGFYWNPSYKG